MILFLNNVVLFSLFTAIQFIFADYHFVTKSVFDRMVKNNDFFENTEFSGNNYGTRYYFDVDLIGNTIGCTVK